MQQQPQLLMCRRNRNRCNKGNAAGAATAAFRVCYMNITHMQHSEYPAIFSRIQLDAPILLSLRNNIPILYLVLRPLRHPRAEPAQLGRRRNGGNRGRAGGAAPTADPRPPHSGGATLIALGAAHQARQV